MVKIHSDISTEEKVNKFQSVAHEAWIEMIRAMNGVSYECHQRYCVFLDCFKYGLTYGESFSCALSCNELPKIVFESSGDKCLKSA